MISSRCTRCRLTYIGTERSTCGRCGNQCVPMRSGIEPKACGIKQEPKPRASAVNMNAYICRQCPSGKYDPKRDACLEVIEIGLAKNQRRAGKINWLHSHAAAKCPLGHF